jgi:predicted aldo/keto reductase-like oxidoreductase
MDTRKEITRRQFLGQVIAGTSAASVAASSAAWGWPQSKEQAGTSIPSGSVGALPKRVLGRTKEKVTILGLGTAPVGEGPLPVEEGIRIFSEAIDRGVTYIDTARIYGEAEEMLGHIIPKQRDKLFVVTKVSTDSAVQAERSLTESLRVLKTDHLDLVHIHSIGSKNIDKVLSKDGVLEYLLKQKETGKLRFIGISGHNRPANFVRMIQTDQIDVLMCVMNYADRNIYGFEDKVLPEARKRNIGCVAMKVYAGIKARLPLAFSSPKVGC